MSNKHFNAHSIDGKNGKSTRRNTSKQERTAAAEAEIAKSGTAEAIDPTEMPKNFQEYVAAILSGQMAAFVESQSRLENTTVDQRKTAETALYRHYWDADFTCAPLTGDWITKTGFTLDRSVRIDRETHKLIRATTTMLFCNRETGKMEYVANAYLTKLYTGSVVVTPIGDNGPLYKESTRVNFNMSNTADT